MCVNNALYRRSLIAQCAGPKWRRSSSYSLSHSQCLAQATRMPPARDNGSRESSVSPALVRDVGIS